MLFCDSIMLFCCTGVAALDRFIPFETLGSQEFCSFFVFQALQARNTFGFSLGMQERFRSEDIFFLLIDVPWSKLPKG